MSQERLGAVLGLTFQQVQKYERGTNRVSASRLFEIARVLTVPINYFFDEMPDGMSDTPISGARGRMVSPEERLPALHIIEDDVFPNRETLALVRAYYRISDRAVRRRMFSLIKSLTTPEAAL